MVIKSIVKKEISRISVIGTGIIRNIDFLRKLLNIIEKNKLEILDYDKIDNQGLVNMYKIKKK